MEDARTNCLVFLLGCVLAAGLGLTGCGGTKLTKTDGSSSAARDGAGPISDAIIPDAGDDLRKVRVSDLAECGVILAEAPDSVRFDSTRRSRSPRSETRTSA
jgi:hypothetical protein